MFQNFDHFITCNLFPKLSNFEFFFSIDCCFHILYVCWKQTCLIWHDNLFHAQPDAPFLSSFFVFPFWEVGLRFNSQMIDVTITRHPFVTIVITSTHAITCNHRVHAHKL